MRLTDEQIDALEIREKVYKVQMGRGLYLQIEPNGEKFWWVKYLSNGKYVRATLLGKFGDLSVKDAWSKSMEVKMLGKMGENTDQLGHSIDLSKGTRTRDQIPKLNKRIKALEEEIAAIKERMHNADMDVMGSIVRAETNWLQEQIDKLKGPKKAKKKVPKKKKVNKRKK